MGRASVVTGLWLFFASSLAWAELPTTVVDLDGAVGPPATSCREEKVAAERAIQVLRPSKSASKTRRKPTPIPPPALPEVDLGDGRAPVPIEQLPDPDTLPLHPLEASPELRSALAKAWAKGASGEGLRISVFGASHTGADLWTGELRRLVQRRWGDRGHGFVLPAPLYAATRAHDLNLCATSGWVGDWAGRRKGLADGLLGLGGMSVRSDLAPAFGWVETTNNNAQGRRVERFDVFTLQGPGVGGVELVVDGLEPLLVPGEAPAAEMVRTRLLVPDGPHRLRVSPVGDGTARIFGVSMERSAPGVLVDAIGVRGRTASTWLSWNRDMAREGLRALDPDVVVLAYGTNEASDKELSMAAYERDLRAVLGELRAAVPDVACVLVGPSDRGIYGDEVYGVWARTEPVASVQRRVAPEFGCAFWDWQGAMGGPGSMVRWRHHDPPLASRDLLHHSRAGYERMARRFLDALDHAAGHPTP